jgi:hypothetical protein
MRTTSLGAQKRESVAQFQSLCAEPISSRFFNEIVEAKTPSKMVAYAIFIKERTRNPAEIEAYKQKAPAGLAGHHSF